MSASTLQGLAVSLSADGNTAIVGGVAGYSQTSSALIWKRSGDVWTHQGTKLVGSEAMGLGNYQQPGVSISLSADGNTAIVGGWNDNSATGAAWIFNMVITSPAQPGTISGNTSICPSSSQTYSISSVSGATSYTWSLPMGWSGNSTTTSIAAIGGSLGGTISVTANNNSGSSPPSSIDVSIVQVPVQPGVISGDTTVCQDQSGVIYEVPQIANATSYIWSLPDGSSGTSTTNSITVNYSTLAVSGNITVKGTNSCGDGATSTLAIDVLAKPATPAISQLDLTLISSSLLGNQWYNQNGIINGALNQNYTVVSNGTYYAIVTIEGCISEPSNSISIINVGISTNEALNSIMLYPNPVSGALNIENEVNIGRINFEILNAIGQVVCKGNFVEKITVQASSFKPGVYFVKFENGKTCEFKKFFKE
jgi:hypothetical protein